MAMKPIDEVSRCKFDAPGWTERGLHETPRPLSSLADFEFVDHD